MALASHGLDVSYHEIARMAELGVGTVYRCYPDRNDLLEAVLLEILDGLADQAEAAAGNADHWTSFAAFFGQLSVRMREHAGLTQRIGERGGARVDVARRRLIGAVEGLVERAKEVGLRRDVGVDDVLFLAQATAAGGCGLDIRIGEAHRARGVDVILDGLSDRRDPPTS